MFDSVRTGKKVFGNFRTPNNKQIQSVPYQGPEKVSCLMPRTLNEQNKSQFRIMSLCYQLISSSFEITFHFNSDPARRTQDESEVRDLIMKKFPRLDCAVP